MKNTEARWYLIVILITLGLKPLWHEADHSPAYVAEVKNAWSYTSTPPVCLHGVVLN
jgi:hypothetical protein